MQIFSSFFAQYNGPFIVFFLVIPSKAIILTATFSASFLELLFANVTNKHS